VTRRNPSGARRNATQGTGSGGVPRSRFKGRALPLSPAGLRLPERGGGSQSFGRSGAACGNSVDRSGAAMDTPQRATADTRRRTPAQTGRAHRERQT